VTAAPKPGSSMAPEFVAALSYVAGAISGVIVLVVEKHDRFVRFHAMQSIITFLGVLVAQILLRNLPVLGAWLSRAFLIGVFLLWGWLMYQAFMGRRYKLPYIGDFAEQQIK
jgi:uncharacterized membrane protein